MNMASVGGVNLMIYHNVIDDANVDDSDTLSLSSGLIKKYFARVSIHFLITLWTVIVDFCKNKSFQMTRMNALVNHV